MRSGIALALVALAIPAVAVAQSPQTTSEIDLCSRQLAGLHGAADKMEREVFLSSMRSADLDARLKWVLDNWVPKDNK